MCLGINLRLLGLISFCSVFYTHFSVLQNADHEILTLSSFADFLQGFLEPEKSMVFFKYPTVEGIVNIIEQKTEGFC